MLLTHASKDRVSFPNSVAVDNKGCVVNCISVRSVFETYLNGNEPLTGESVTANVERK